MLSKAGIAAPCFHVVNCAIAIHLYKTQARVILLWKAATPAVLLEVSRHDIQPRSSDWNCGAVTVGVSPPVCPARFIDVSLALRPRCLMHR